MAGLIQSPLADDGHFGTAVAGFRGCYLGDFDSDPFLMHNGYGSTRVGAGLGSINSHPWCEMGVGQHVGGSYRSDWVVAFHFE